MSNATLKKAMENAEASIKMEGLYVSESCKNLCEKLMRQEISFEDYLLLISEEVNAYGI